MRFDPRALFKAPFLGKLSVRLLAVTIAPVFITLISVAVLANYVTIGQFESFLSQDTQQRDDRLQTVLVRFYGDQGTWTGVDSTIQRTAALVGERLVLTDASGKVVSDSGGQLVGQQQGRNWRRALPLTTSAGVRVGTLYINPTLPGRASSLKVQAFLESVNRSLIIGCAVAVVVGALLVVLFTNRLRRQLAVIIRVARQLGHGDLSLRVPAPERGDLGDLGSAINGMAEDLERQMRARQQMVADVAHELRTPLQNINGYIEALRDGVLPADERTLGVLTTETAVLRRLVDDLQDLSLADTGRLPVQMGIVRAQDQIEAIVESMRPRAEELGISVAVSAPDDLPEIEADERRLRQVIVNLAQNALAYTPAGGRISIQARPVGGTLEITVADTGVGISAEDQERIFERFYRVDPARARSTGGAGLGLTIARELVHAMHGQIGVTSKLGEGSQFWIRLPLAIEPEPEVVASAPPARSRTRLGLAKT
ncbi:MAG TPA: HAMP domain-containing sensor histidine kinase [Chloroflexota bacterium]|nr:HAMP domain-containing sensor histidine kinase [Chloroflexota bacterium]